ncbi:TPA: hypothetical protein ACGIKW_003816 [Acinetobacter baumannii]|uniref:hypothetical protein n=1 Tax=Acinetobacter baumannii TaxID=470 RepID=UPI0023415A4D|nr:hypothetical protein [Acinetobacter baumannii]HCA5045202.1 hypothetical protein [Acinetobacter baumannii]
MKNRLKPWVYKKILDLIDLDSQSAEKQQVIIESIEITEELHSKIHKYIAQNHLGTHFRYGRGGRWGGGSHYQHCYNFTLVIYRKPNTSKYYLNNGGAMGCDVSRKNNEKQYGPLEERTPTILKLFYGILRKYPDHILNVKWRYDMALDDPERPF